MKTILLILSFTIFTCNSLFAQSGWFTVRSDTSIYWQSNFFADANSGYAVGGKVIGGVHFPLILKTTNAGSSWFEQITPQRDSAGFFLRSIFFTDINTGFITVAHLTNINIGRILKTTNGGNNWNIVPLPLSVHLINLYFSNSNTGYVSGYQTLLKTTDAGTTWAIQNPNLPLAFFAIHFTDVNTGYVVGWNGTIIKTTNGGTNWNALITGSTQHLWGVHFADANTGIAVGGDPSNTQNIILRTTNAGLTWTQIAYTNSSCLLWSVRFISPSTGWITGWCNQILKTTNGGLNWDNQATPISNSYRTSFFTSAQTGYVVGEGATFTDPTYILKTTNGGGNFVGIGTAANEVPAQFHLFQNYPNPFNPTTKIKFDIPTSGEIFGTNLTAVRIVIYDVFGREVTMLINDQLKPGNYEVEWNAANYPSGIYFYKINTNNFSDTKRMILLK